MKALLGTKIGMTAQDLCEVTTSKLMKNLLSTINENGVRILTGYRLTDRKKRSVATIG